MLADTVGLARARKVVKLAAKKVKDRYAKAWLTMDERGSWEKLADEELRSTAEKAGELGLSPEEHEIATAQYLCYLALQAQIDRRTKGRG